MEVAVVFTTLEANRGADTSTSGSVGTPGTGGGIAGRLVPLARDAAWARATPSHASSGAGKQTDPSVSVLAQ